MDCPVIGCDPGLSGALVVNVRGQITQVYPMPIINTGNKRQYFEAGIQRILEPYAPHPCHMIIEKQQAHPGQGVVSMFTTGYGFGILVGLASGLKIPFTLVLPQTWQRMMFQGVSGDDTKEISKLVASRLWPNAQFTKPKGKVLQDGLCDASLISEWGRRHLLGLSSLEKKNEETPVEGKKVWTPYRPKILRKL